MENLVNVLITVLKNILSIKYYVLKIGNLIVFNVLYTVINTISNILNYIFG
jgi:Mg2+/Co2+ transporter CorB